MTSTLQEGHCKAFLLFYQNGYTAATPSPTLPIGRLSDAGNFLSELVGNTLDVFTTMTEQNVIGVRILEGEFFFSSCSDQLISGHEDFECLVEILQQVLDIFDSYRKPDQSIT